MHDADLLFVIGFPDLRGERKAGLFGYWKAIHIRTEGHDRTRFPTVQEADDTGFRDAGLHIHAQ